MITEDRIAVALLLSLAVAVLTMVGFVVVDAVQEYRAWPAITDCRSQTMDHARRPLSTEVRCVPFDWRDDRYNVRLETTP